MSIHELQQGIPDECFFLTFGKEREKQMQCVKHFLAWLFNDLIIGMVRTCFHVTESAANRNRIFYYRHDVWLQVTAVSKQRFIDRMLEPGDKSNVTYSKVRFIPKESGKSFRPVVNLRRNLGNSSSVNSQLRNLFEVLNYHRQRKPELMGASVLGYDGVRERLTSFKQGGPFFMAKVDVKSCFDSIPHAKLLEIIASLLRRESEYRVRKYDTLSWWNGRIRRKFKRVAYQAGDLPQFHDLPAHNSLLIDRVIGTHCSSKDLLKQLNAHLVEHYIRLDGQVYRQKVGIPQGSILSSLLCSLFYGDMDTREFKFLLHRPDTV